jgi:hypothetical protein
MLVGQPYHVDAADDQLLDRRHHPGTNVHPGDETVTWAASPNLKEKKQRSHGEADSRHRDTSDPVLAGPLRI